MNDEASLIIRYVSTPFHAKELSLGRAITPPGQIVIDMYATAEEDQEALAKKVMQKLGRGYSTNL
jgi:hypothetical protein